MHTTRTLNYSHRKDESLDDTNGVTYAVVLNLVERLEHKGHHLYCDSYYTSPTLFSCLRALGFGACGTARGDQKRMPKSLASAKLQKGEVITCDVNKCMLALKWSHNQQDTTTTPWYRRTVGHDSQLGALKTSNSRRWWRTYMGGVDKSDQLLSYYGFSHRTVKWWRRVFFHLFDMAIVNAYILYCMSSQPGRKRDTRILD